MSIGKRFLYGAGMLGVCSIVAKIIGVFYRIPLTNILGAEGVGIYQLAFPLFAMLLTLSSGGLPVAISRVVAGKIAAGDRLAAKKVLHVALVSLCIVAGLASMLIVLLSGPIARAQGNEMAHIAYLGLAPSIVFVAALSAYRGYFQGMQNMLPSSLSQLAEQVVKLFLGLGLAIVMLPLGLQYAVLGAVIGVSVSEGVAFVVMYTMYVLQEKQRVMPLFDMSTAADTVEVALDIDMAELALQSDSHATSDNSVRSILKAIYKVAMPVTIGALILPLTQIFDSMVVINFLTQIGITSAQATAQYGIVNGPVASLINMPILLTMALAVAILPKVAAYKTRQCIQEGDIGVQQAVTDGLYYAMALVLPAAAGLMLYSQDIMCILYGSLSASQRALGADILRLSAIIVVYVSILQITTAVLQGLDKAHTPAIILGIAAVVKISTTLVLLPIIGIYGVAIATVLFYIIATTISVLAVRRHIAIGGGLYKIGKLIVLTALSMGAGYTLCLILQQLPQIPRIVALGAAATLAGTLYVGGYILLKISTQSPKNS
jgi:stage V sporulation protein B